MLLSIFEPSLEFVQRITKEMVVAGVVLHQKGIFHFPWIKRAPALQTKSQQETY